MVHYFEFHGGNKPIMMADFSYLMSMCSVFHKMEKKTTKLPTTSLLALQDSNLTERNHIFSSTKVEDDTKERKVKT